LTYQTHIKITSYAAFLFTLAIVLLNLIAVVFPAFFIKSVNPYPNNLNPFELGSLAVPLIVANVILIGIGLGYYKKKLPSNIYKAINFFLNFEISKKVTLVVSIIIIAIYIGFSVSELSLNEADQWPDYQILKRGLEIWPSGESDDIYVREQNDRYVRMVLLSASQEIFQNIKILPFIASIALVIVTYFLTVEISKKRFAGIISMAVLLQSHTFLEFDTIAVYENFWVLFYVLSLYVIYKRWYFSSILYVLSVFTKAFVAPFLLMTIFSIYRTNIGKKTKLLTLVSYGLAVALIVGIFVVDDSIYGNLVRIDYSEFVIGFSAWYNQMRSDVFLILAVLPLTIGLFLTSKSGVSDADSILVLMGGVLLLGPVLGLLTDFYFVLPYRYVPLIVFFAIGIGVFLSKRSV
jgi:hypothetical protein